MLACPKCGNCEDFLVQECVWQETRITCEHETYTVGETSFREISEWGEITCGVCGHVDEEETLKEEYERVCDANDNPIPYTLVDASVS